MLSEADRTKAADLLMQAERERNADDPRAVGEMAVEHGRELPNAHAFAEPSRRVDEAITQYRQILVQRPDDARVRENLAQALELQRRNP